jgi:dTMP kinase
MKGCLISIEGTDGCGKSTQIELIKKFMEENKIESVFLREPGGTETCEKIRNILLNKGEMCDEAELLLFAASRAELINKVILPSLESNKVVVLDRFVDSSYAYQGYANNNFKNVKLINDYATNGLLPDLTLFFNISPITAEKRKNGYDKNDRIESKGLEYQNKVYDGYLKLLNKFKDRIVSIDATKSIDEVFSSVKENILKVLKSKNLI